MAKKRSPARQRLINAALELFASQGVTETTTRQIAERAGVNEVTLFRQFGNKHGLLLSALEETEVFTSIARSLAQDASEMGSLEQALEDYVEGRLEALEAMPEFVRSLVGESGQYPAASRQSLGRELTQANRFVAQYLLTAMEQGSFQTRLPSEKLASLLNSLLLGYAVLGFTSEFHQLWDNRQDFVEHVVHLFLHGAVESLSEDSGDAMVPRQPSRFETVSEFLSHPSDVAAAEVSEGIPEIIEDLPAAQVHDLLKQAKMDGPQAAALFYVLFGSGLSAAEIAQLQWQHRVMDGRQVLLQVPGTDRLVPLNQWIVGKRYGSAHKNLLTQWLKTRKDDHPHLFVQESVDAHQTGKSERIIPAEFNAEAESNTRKSTPVTSCTAIKPDTIQSIWQRVWQRYQVAAATTAAATTAEEADIPPLSRAQQTWRIDMLMRGISPENLSLLSGLSIPALQPYIQRANLKKAIKQAAAMDRKQSD